MEDRPAPQPPTRYRWPWFVLIAVVAFFLLTILWVSVAIRRTREQSEWAPLPGQTTTGPSR